MLAYNLCCFSLNLQFLSLLKNINNNHHTFAQNTHLKKLRIGAVSYLNTKPLLYGIRQSGLLQTVDLVEDYPARVAAMLLNDEIDIGLVPVAVLPQLKEYHIISNYCIGADKDVASVSLFAQQPLETISTVLLDYQSRTSVALTKILFKNYWKKEVRFINADANYIEKINSTTAGVIIGDRALQLKDSFAYDYDLSTAWQSFTGLPFVFATWVANKKMDEDFITRFNAANQLGLQHIDEVVKQIDFPFYDIKHYYTHNISYQLDEPKKKALDLFLNLLNTV